MLRRTHMLSEWFEDRIRALRGGTPGDWCPRGDDARKMMELERLRDEARRLEALDAQADA